MLDIRPSPVTVSLTRDEARHLARSERCGCGHLDAFHGQDEWVRYCEIDSCYCETGEYPDRNLRHRQAAAE